MPCNKLFITIGLFLSIMYPGFTQQPLRLWYTQEAKNFNEALPIGNGRIGAMVYGGIQNEYLSINEQTLWSGDPAIETNNAAAKNYLAAVRHAALSGEYKKADSLSKFMQGPYTESYLPMADLSIAYEKLENTTGYSRSLSLDSAICATSFTSNNSLYQRTVFASFPDKVIIIQNTASKKGLISFTVKLSSKLKYKIHGLNTVELVLQGKCPNHVEPAYVWKTPASEAIQYAAEENGPGMTFEVRLRLKTEGGRITISDSIIQVNEADASTILITAATSFNGYNKSPVLAAPDPGRLTLEAMDHAASLPYNTLLERHLADYMPIINRVSINLGKSGNQILPTDDRLKKMSVEFDPELLATIIQFGRYLLIASSRPGGQPGNLKGLWNEKIRPEYSSNWCLDHDAQMFYYPAETNNLSEFHEPFLQLIQELSLNGYSTARTNYGKPGWCAHHNTDIWRRSSPVGNWGEGNPHWATWNMSAAWLCAHLFNHYLFTGDQKFLSEKAWPVMKGAAEFSLAWLIENKSGHLVSVPSVSPENTFITPKGDTAQISVNATSDIELMRDLFGNCIRAAEILHLKNPFTDSLKTAFKKLMPYPIGKNGQLLEWAEEWQSTDLTHRHLSHMYAVFPGSEISPWHTPELAEAAKKALSLRQKTNSSWGFAWKAACWARLSEGDSAWNTLRSQLQYVDPQSISAEKTVGLYPNLFNSEVPNIILNGNTCISAVITEMLMQSHTGEIRLLPALPNSLHAGSVKGLCAQSGFVIDLEWKDNQLKKASIHSTLGNLCTLFLPKGFNVYSKYKRLPLAPDKSGLVSFLTKKGELYEIMKDQPDQLPALTVRF